MVEISNENIPPVSDDEENDQDEEDLEEDEDDLEEADDERDNSVLNEMGVRQGSQMLRLDGQQTEASSPPPAKKGRSELARFYEAAVKGRTLRSTAPGQLGPGNFILVCYMVKIHGETVVKSINDLRSLTIYNLPQMTGMKILMMVEVGEEVKIPTMEGTTAGKRQ